MNDNKIVSILKWIGRPATIEEIRKDYLSLFGVELTTKEVMKLICEIKNYFAKLNIRPSLSFFYLTQSVTSKNFLHRIYL